MTVTRLDTLIIGEMAVRVDDAIRRGESDEDIAWKYGFSLSAVRERRHGIEAGLERRPRTLAQVLLGVLNEERDNLDHPVSTRLRDMAKEIQTVLAWLPLDREDERSDLTALAVWLGTLAESAAGIESRAKSADRAVATMLISLGWQEEVMTFDGKRARVFVDPNS